MQNEGCGVFVGKLWEDALIADGFTDTKGVEPIAGGGAAWLPSPLTRSSRHLSDCPGLLVLSLDLRTVTVARCRSSRKPTAN